MGMSKRNALRTNIHIDHVIVNGVKHYQGHVSINRKHRADICTPVMSDGCECLRAVEALEAQVRSGALV